MATTQTAAKKTKPSSTAKSAAGAKAAVKKPVAAKAAAAKKTVATEPKKAAAPKKPAAPRAAVAKITITPEQRYCMIAEAAYFHAERRGFRGDPVRDWVAAEKEIEALLNKK